MLIQFAFGCIEQAKEEDDNADKRTNKQVSNYDTAKKLTKIEHAYTICSALMLDPSSVI
jgi:hypothetical protein